MDAKKIYYLDLLERVVWTLIEGALGFWIDHAATGEVTWRAVVYAGAIAVAKAILAKRIGSSQSAATLPSPPDYAGPLRSDEVEI